MVGELVEHFKTEPVLVEFNDFNKLIRGAATLRWALVKFMTVSFAALRHSQRHADGVVSCLCRVQQPGN